MWYFGNWFQVLKSKEERNDQKKWRTEDVEWEFSRFRLTMFAIASGTLVNTLNGEGQKCTFNNCGFLGLVLAAF